VCVCVFILRLFARGWSCSGGEQHGNVASCAPPRPTHLRPMPAMEAGTPLCRLLRAAGRVCWDIGLYLDIGLHLHLRIATVRGTTEADIQSLVSGLILGIHTALLPSR
jgi:hypothetical protein